MDTPDTRFRDDIRSEDEDDERWRVDRGDERDGYDESVKPGCGKMFCGECSQEDSVRYVLSYLRAGLPHLLDIAFT